MTLYRTVFVQQSVVFSRPDNLGKPHPYPQLIFSRQWLSCVQQGCMRAKGIAPMLSSHCEHSFACVTSLFFQKQKHHSVSSKKRHTIRRKTNSNDFGVFGINEQIRIRISSLRKLFFFLTIRIFGVFKVQSHTPCGCKCACAVACLHPHNSNSNIVVSGGGRR